MSETIELTLDDKNHVIIPPSLQEQLGLTAGMTLVAEQDDAGRLYLRVQPETLPVLIDKDGVTVVRAEPLDDLRNVIDNERNQRAKTLLEQTGL